jgi:hypothetical protein
MMEEVTDTGNANAKGNYVPHDNLIDSKNFTDSEEITIVMSPEFIGEQTRLIRGETPVMFSDITIPKSFKWNKIWTNIVALMGCLFVLGIITTFIICLFIVKLN